MIKVCERGEDWCGFFCSRAGSDVTAKSEHKWSDAKSIQTGGEKQSYNPRFEIMILLVKFPSFILPCGLDTTLRDLRTPE